ncbi:hypothetical protein KI811_07980 [Geobacter hydrogenophilus]|uniref:Uncharacterized protein n=1 Tax=Geobacter hydrogenophilus TaxID=40983 RepID=A0A9W6FZ61_9BACT|nr:hypothetical protein [Geobacter hydrogenophilus]MBT0893749.1 hypothetical protein [Geobacter hydrogenophilus]GLI37556.1 hypothetical protein GHYDROH2_10570 [Geobacter hydrogenophilus]
MRDISDERGFQEAVQRALKAMGEKVEAQSVSRRELVIKRLKEEIDRLRPHADRLLHGEPQNQKNND